MKKILVYGTEEEDVDLLREIADTMGIAVYTLSSRMLDMTFRQAMTAETDAEPDGSEEGEYFLLQEISPEELTYILRKGKEADTEFESLKIMRTEENENWTLRRLFETAAVEHEAVQKAYFLRSLIISCDGLDFNAMEKAAADQLKKEIVRSYRLLSSEEFTPQEVNDCLNDLMQAMRNARTGEKFS